MDVEREKLQALRALTRNVAVVADMLLGLLVMSVLVALVSAVALAGSL